MFTSRAEYRLQLREDNADLRLTEQGRELRVVGEAQWRYFSNKREAISREKRRLESEYVQPDSAVARKIMPHLPKPLTREYSLADLLKRPEITSALLYGAAPPDRPVEESVAEQVTIQFKYAGYIDRQQEDVSRLQRHEAMIIPANLNFYEVDGLSHEICQKLSELRPTNLARAGRIPGVTPAAMSLLLVYLKKRALLESSRATANG